MSTSVNLPEPIYKALSRAAAESGTTPAGWIAAHLPAASDVSNSGAQSLADMFKGRLGKIAGANHETLSENCAENFASDLLAKRRDGHL